MLSTKCELYGGNFGDDCNSRFGAIGYYEFFADGKFKRQNCETCRREKNYVTTGFWKTMLKNENLFLEITLSNKSKLKYHIIYIDREGNMVADLK